MPPYIGAESGFHVRQMDDPAVGQIPYRNTDSQAPIAAKYRVDSLFNLAKINKKSFFVVFLQFPDRTYGKSRQER